MASYEYCKIKNDTGSTVTYVGTGIAAATYYEIQNFERERWAKDPDVKTAIQADELVVNDGDEDLNAKEGLNHLRGVGVGTDIHIDCYNGTKPACENDQTSWKTAKRFIFLGIKKRGTPSGLVASVRAIGTTGTVRLYDVTNGNPIGSATISNDSSWHFVTDKNLQNLPNGRALFDLRIKSGTAGQKVFVTAAILRW